MGTQARSCSDWLRRPRARPKYLGLYRVVADCWQSPRSDPPATPSPPPTPPSGSSRATAQAHQQAPCQPTRNRRGRRRVEPFGWCGWGAGEPVRVRREMRLRRRPHPAARSRTKRQNPLPPFRLQRVLRNLRQLPKLARCTTPRKKKPAGAMDGPAGRGLPAWRAGLQSKQARARMAGLA
jgi:hypothetical protein